MNKKIKKILGAISFSGILLFLLIQVAAGQSVVDPGFFLGEFATVTDPFHLSFDGDGYLFVGRDNSGSGGTSASDARIHKVSPDGITVVEYGESIDDPDGVIVDIEGHLTAANYVLVASSLQIPDESSRITEISLAETTTPLVTVSPHDSTMTNPQQLVFNSTGKLLYANCGPGTVGTIETDGSLTPVVFADVGYSTCLGGIAVDSDDNVFVADFFNGKIIKIDSAGDVIDANFVTGLDQPDAMAFDDTGLFGDNIFVVERGNGNIVSVDPETGTPQLFASGFDRPFGLAFGPDSCLYVSEFDDDKIWRICAMLSIELTPSSDINPIDSDHTVTASISPVIEGLEVDFSVTGQHTIAGSVPIEPNGQASFVYSGSTPGTDTIVASVTYGGMTFSSTPVTKHWFDAYIEAGGFIVDDDGTIEKRKDWQHVSYSGAVYRIGSSSPIPGPGLGSTDVIGHWTTVFHNVSIDSFDKTTFESTSIVQANFFDDGTVANFTALGTLDGVPGFKIIVRLEDNGEPGHETGSNPCDSPHACDTIRIELWEGSTRVYDTSLAQGGPGGDFPNDSNHVGTARTFIDGGNIDVEDPLLTP